MAVARMRKVTLLGHSTTRAQVTRQVQQQGLLEVVSARQDGEGAPLEGLSQELHDLEIAIHKCNFLLSFLGEFETEKKSFFRSMMAPRVYLTREQYEMIEGKVPFEGLYEECEDLDDELNSLRAARARLASQKAGLEPWAGLDIPLSATKGTSRVRLLLGIVPSAELEALRDELAETAPLSDLQVVSEVSQQASCAVLTHASAIDDANSVLQRHGFKQVSFEAEATEPRREIERIDGELAAVDAKEKTVLARVNKLIGLRDDVLALREHLQDRHDRAGAQERFYHTKQGFLLEGWVKARDAAALVKSLEDVRPAVEIAVTDPEPDDTPPVELDNARIVRPFEVLTRLYGYPSHDEIDPTPWMAPFFFLFFGMALGDFGYGLVLALGCWWAIRHFDLRGNVRNFMHLMIYGGLASMLVGVVTGGYFGVEMKDLPELLRAMVLIDPLNQALEFMIIAVMLGIVHVLLGVVLEGADAVRHGDIAGAVFDQASTFVFLVSALVAFAGWIVLTVAGKLPPLMARVYPVSLVALGLSVAGVVLLQGRVHEGVGEALGAIRGSGPKETAEVKRAIPASLDGAIGLLALVALASWIATFFILSDLNGAAGKALAVLVVVGLAVSPLARKTLGRLWNGTYNLYGMSGFIGDFLSYARLMAIGLATVLIGMVINILAKMIFATPYVGIPLGILILLVGHGFNLVINLLGAFVHPTRLQFVEFFSKFYDDGGAKFSPLAIRTKHLIFLPGEGRS